MRLSYKVEIQPTPKQIVLLWRHVGGSRAMYNWGLARQKQIYAEWVSEGRPEGWKGWKNWMGLNKEIRAIKKLPEDQGGKPWLKALSSRVPTYAFQGLDRAFTNFREGRGKFPRFKKRGRCRNSFGAEGTVKISQKTVRIPVVGTVRIKPGDHGYLPVGIHKDQALRVSERAGRWFVSFVSKTEHPEAEPNGGPTVGLDLGVARLATLSDGTVIENPKALQRGQRKLRKAQQALSRKKKGSNRWHKTKSKVARIHYRVSNIRKDHLHKITTSLTKNHGKLVIEDLKVSGMSRKGGSRKRGLNRVIMDASWAEFRRMLEYKGKLYGCSVEAVDPRYTSQTCSSCGQIDKSSRLSQTVFVCTSCGFKINADLNAAKNIKSRGVATGLKNTRGEFVSLGDLRIPEQISVKRGSMGLEDR